MVPAKCGAIGIQIFCRAVDRLIISDQAIWQNRQCECFRIDQ